MAKLGEIHEITGKTKVFYSNLGEIAGKTRGLPCGHSIPILHSSYSVISQPFTESAKQRAVYMIIYRKVNEETHSVFSSKNYS